MPAYDPQFFAPGRLEHGNGKCKTIMLDGQPLVPKKDLDKVLRKLAPPPVPSIDHRIGRMVSRGKR